MIISPNISKHDKELIEDVFVVIVNGVVGMMITAAMHCYCIYNDGVAGHHTL